jgi:hypothetical protein
MAVDLDGAAGPGAVRAVDLAMRAGGEVVRGLFFGREMP